jgi:hypothetical protein
MYAGRNEYDTEGPKEEEPLGGKGREESSSSVTECSEASSQHHRHIQCHLWNTISTHFYSRSTPFSTLVRARGNERVSSFWRDVEKGRWIPCITPQRRRKSSCHYPPPPPPFVHAHTRHQIILPVLNNHQATYHGNRSTFKTTHR